MTAEKYYAAIDLKSFYASVECVDRQLDPMTTNLVVADGERTEKTICLAVSPSLKALGIPGRPRLFEVVEQVKKINGIRKQIAPGGSFSDKSADATLLRNDPAVAVDYIVATPRLARYMQFSARIYEVYLKYLAPEDIHVYSVDEVFLDITHYLAACGKTPREFVSMIILDILHSTGITAAGGIGTNLYLCKVAMDILAKHESADSNGVRIAQLDEFSYRKRLWTHRPLTDFWRVGPGYARKLEKVGLHTMGDIARCSVGDQEDYYNEDLLYDLFGINAELLIDHAWGWEPCTIDHIKAYRPRSNSISSGQVLHCPYTWEKARLVLREMTDLLVLDLVEKGFVTDQMVLTVGYDIENLTDPMRSAAYRGMIDTDHYGRKVPRHAHGTANLHRANSSTAWIIAAVMDLYDRITDKRLLVRRINLTAAHVRAETELAGGCVQMDLFCDREKEDALLAREKRRQKAVLGIKKRFGKNAIIKGMNLEEGATAMDRNRQIGGHKG